MFKFYHLLLRIPLIFLKNKTIPQDPVQELDFDLEQPFLYILPYSSNSDLAILRKNCLALGLPDPLLPNKIQDKSLTRYIFLDKESRFIKQKKLEVPSVLTSYLRLLMADQNINLQLVPTSILWGRSPGRDDQTTMPKLRFFNWLEKFFLFIRLRKDIYVRFSRAVSLQQILQEHKLTPSLIRKLTRVAKIHFAKQKVSVTGPRLPNRQNLFQDLLETPSVISAIQDEAQIPKSNQQKAEQKAHKILEEIAANFNFRSLRLADIILTWLWNKLYSGIKISNADRVRELALDGHEIIYLPCHRSHIDYLLLSYILYHQGLVPPHIAAGINLNFWPVGGVFRRWGAFFIRRKFGGDRLYTTIFREYLAELFARGYPVEFFIEGGRSRTGKLLQPKTGMLSMTLQAMQNRSLRPISLIPVYIGYESVLEVDTYFKELQGASKEKESAWLVFRVFKKLSHLGKGFVNFGEPINVNNYLNNNYPEWRDDGFNNNNKPEWFAPAIEHFSQQIMTNINCAVAINPMNLITSILLNSNLYSQTRDKLINLINSYRQLLINAPYSEDIILPEESAEDMLNYVLSFKNSGIEITPDDFGDIISLTNKASILMAYYRNNVQHVFIIPGLVASLILNYKTISKERMVKIVKFFYPFLKAEYFLPFTNGDLDDYINNIVCELDRQQLINQDADSFSINEDNIDSLHCLSNSINNTLVRYYISFILLSAEPDISRAQLEKDSHIIAKRLFALYGINSPAFFDKSIFTTLINSLKTANYLDNKDVAISKELDKVNNVLSTLIPIDIRKTILSSIAKNKF